VSDFEEDVSFGDAAPVPAVHILPGEEVELAYLGAVLGDPDGLLFAQGRTLPVLALGNLEARKLWRALQEGCRVDDVLGLVGKSGVPMGRVLELSQMDRMGTMASIHLDEIWRRHRLRLQQALARKIAESQTIEPEEWKKAIDGIAEGSGDVNHSLPLSDFKIPPDGDRSILLGNRFLNRGDGGVISSTSGVGKSSMSLQAAVLWALAMDFFGIKPNGALKSLVVQSEDSEGDVAEVWASIKFKLQLTEAQVRIVEQRVIIVSDRTHRGAAFIANLRLLVRKHKPDIVWINPLQAFIDGDVTDSKDLGKFLREGLNGLNEPPDFGIILVHHTTKPAAPGSNQEERRWSETMYDMAGGAEIINWARFIMSLRATDAEGKFNLVLAKRGRRAGITKQVEQGAGFRDEIVTSVAIQHAHEMMEIPGRKGKLPVIFWEPSDHDPKPKKAAKGQFGPSIDQILPAFRVAPDKAITLNQAVRAVKSIVPMSQAKLAAFIAEAVASGKLVKGGPDREPTYYAP
jgi:hypothetical protein